MKLFLTQGTFESHKCHRDSLFVKTGKEWMSEVIVRLAFIAGSVFVEVHNKPWEEPMLGRCP